MAKVRKIGDKKEILKRQKEESDVKALIGGMADKSEEEVLKWFRAQFKELPKQVRDGLETVIKTLWANAKILRKLGIK